VAKKRKGARPTKKAARSVKKKSAPRKAMALPKTGLEKPGKVNFNPLKDQIGKHIARLEAATVSNPQITEALRVLRQTHSDLTAACLPTMELQTS
jgi:hypothetical protein